MAYLYLNLLVGSHDLSTVSWGDKAKRSDNTFWGATVADLGAGQWGIIFPTESHRADARATSGAEYVLSFFARADVAGDKIHSEVWGSAYALDTTLTTEWQQVVMPYGIVKADARDIFFWGLNTNSGIVHIALPMCVRGTEPAAWAPAEGENLAGGGALMSANLWDASAANFKPDADGVYICGTSTGELNCSIAGASALTENQTIHMSASLRRAYNLLKGTGDGSWAGWKSDSTHAFGTAVVSRVADGNEDDTNRTRIGLVPRKGGSVTLSFWCKASQECEVVSHLFADMENAGNAKKHVDDGTDIDDGFVVARVGTEWTHVRHTWTYDEDPLRDPTIIVARLTRVPVGVTVSVAGVMLVEGDQPAAWAPAEGEDIGYLKPFVRYKDAAGKLNWVGFLSWTPTDQWQRFEATCVVPSGMTPTKFGLDASAATGNMEVSNPVWSYGSAPLTLASAEHTRGYIVRVPLSVCNGIVSMHVSACPLSIETQAIIH